MPYSTTFLLALFTQIDQPWSANILYTESIPDIRHREILNKCDTTKNINYGKNNGKMRSQHRISQPQWRGASH